MKASSKRCNKDNGSKTIQQMLQRQHKQHDHHHQRSSKSQEHKTKSQPKGLLHNPGLLLEAKRRLGEVTLQQNQHNQQVVPHRTRFRLDDEVAEPAELASPLITLSDCSILRSSRLLQSASNQLSSRLDAAAPTSSAAADASPDLASALKRLRAARSASASAGITKIKGGVSAVTSSTINSTNDGTKSKTSGDTDSFCTAMLQSFNSTELRSLVQSGVDSLATGRSYTHQELQAVVKRVSASFLTNNIVPTLLERLESMLMRCLLDSGSVACRGDSYIRASPSRSSSRSGNGGGGSALEGAPTGAPVPKLRTKVPPQIRSQSGRCQHLHQRQSPSPQPTPVALPSGDDQRAMSLYFASTGRLNRSCATSSPNRSQSPYFKSQQAGQQKRSASVRVDQSSYPDQDQSFAATTAGQSCLSSLEQPQHQQHYPNQQHSQPVTHQFIVRDDQQLCKVLNDPEDRRIASVGQRYGCLITVYDRTRRLGHNAHRVTVCAPCDKSLRMCSRALDKAMGWDFTSQLAYYARRQRGKSAAAASAAGNGN